MLICFVCSALVWNKRRVGTVNRIGLFTRVDFKLDREPQLMTKVDCGKVDRDELERTVNRSGT